MPHNFATHNTNTHLERAVTSPPARVVHAYFSRCACDTSARVSSAAASSPQPPSELIDHAQHHLCLCTQVCSSFDSDRLLDHAAAKLIEIVPFSKQQLDAFKTSKAEIVIPGSKSITNRAIVLAALGEGTVTLNGALWSEDTEAMTDCMQKLGISAVVEPDPKVAANRIITVTGCGGKIPKGGTEEAPLELFVANAGTAARFLTAMVCLGSEGQVFRLSGVPRMHERPQKELIRALRALGYRVETPNDKLPAVVYGGGAKPGPIVVSVDDSSQFASALLLSHRTAAGGKCRRPKAATRTSCRTSR